MINVFLFDLDGTIVKTDHLYFNIWHSILKEFNIDLTEELFNNFIQGHADNDVLLNFGLGGLSGLNKYNLNDISTRKDNYIIENIDKIIVIDGFLDFVKSLKEKNMRISIVTNCNRNVAEKIIKELSLEIDYLIIGPECTRPKPYPDPYKIAIENYIVNDSYKIFIFEDSKSGLLSASGCCDKCITRIGITTYYSENELKKYGAMHVIDNYKNLDINSLYLIQTNSQQNFTHDLEEDIRKSLGWMPFKNNDKIIITDTKLKGGFISDVLQVTINNVPCVLKLENKNENFLSTMATKLNLYSNEYYFYESISKYVNNIIRVPVFYGLVKNSSFENIGLLMEDLSSNYIVGPNLNNMDIDISLSIIKKFAKMHVYYRHDNALKQWPYLKFPNYSDAISIKEASESFIKKWPLSELEVTITKKIANNFNKIENYLKKSKRHTLCHGDVKSANMFITNDFSDVCFIDWQYVHKGLGTQDFIFFLIESFSTESINKWYTIFFEYYYSIISIEDNYKDYSKEEYKLDILYSMCYFPFFVAMWFGNVDSDHLIDKNFPYFYIRKLFNVYKIVDIESFLNKRTLNEGL
jgi:beta-phosphoglucomutase